MQKKTLMISAGAALLIAGVGAASYAVADRGMGWRDGGPGHSGHGRRGGRHIEEMLERFDADKNGKLTQAEIDTARKDQLARFDTNKDGKLTIAEFEPLWLEHMRNRMVRGFQRLDENGDASIESAEFMKPIERVVSRLDRNDDGTLDEADRGRWSRGERRPMPPEGTPPAEATPPVAPGEGAN